MARFEKMGDLFEPVLELKQKLPDLKAVQRRAGAGIEIAAQADENVPPPEGSEKKSPKAAGQKTRKV